MSRASSRPEITSIGKPSTCVACAKKASRLRASRRVCVATARTCWGGNPAKRSPKRAKQSQPLCIAAAVKLRSASKPAPWRTVSLMYSVRSNAPWSTTPISRRKLLEPKSMAARRFSEVIKRFIQFLLSKDSTTGSPGGVLWRHKKSPARAGLFLPPVPPDTRLDSACLWNLRRVLFFDRGHNRVNDVDHAVAGHHVGLDDRRIFYGNKITGL